MSANVFDIPVHRISGEPTTLAPYRGNVLLIVNVASKCAASRRSTTPSKSFTPASSPPASRSSFPANDFGAQEPGTNEEIHAFCTSTFGVEFPMFAKIAVTGPETHPLYEALIAAQPEATSPDRPGFRANLNGFLAKSGATTNPEPGILWNFEKFIIGRDGSIAARISPEVTPDDPIVVDIIEAALSK